MLVAEVAEVDGTRYGDHLPHAGRRPAGDDVPHALATCHEDEPTLAPHITLVSTHTHTHHTSNQSDLRSDAFICPSFPGNVSFHLAASTISARVLCDLSASFANFLLVAVILKQFLSFFLNKVSRGPVLIFSL